jgi:hypothetical protein
MPLQGARRQTVIPAKINQPHSAAFKFDHEPLDFLPASPPPDLDSLGFVHISSSPKNQCDD